MKRQLIALAAAGVIATPVWAADGGNGVVEEKGNKELIGVGSGAAVGAIAGGPIGLIVGAAVGGWIGDRFDHEQRSRRTAERDADIALARAESALAQADSLRSVLLDNERELARLESQLRAGERAQQQLLHEAIDVHVLFRTADATLDQESVRRLTRLADLIRPLATVAVHLTGHTDARGDEQYNLKLSAERASAVRDVLVQAGLPAERIVISAEGKRQASAADGDHEAMAFDRRVEMRLLSEEESRAIVARQ